MRIYFDLESTNLLNKHSIDYTQLPFKLKSDYRVHCLVAKSVDTGKVWKLTPDDIEKTKKLFSKVTEVIGHNIINFDLRVLQLKFGIDFEIDLEGVEDKIMGRPCKITDTLVISRLLNPDRFGGHSLDAWGKRLGILKGDYGKQQDAWDKYTPEMLEYCVQDVEVTEATYKALMEEWGDWDWSDAYKTEKITAYLVGVSEHYGYKFDRELAEEALEKFNKEMQEIEDAVEPLLPAKPMGKTSAKAYIPPKIQLKKNGEPSAAILKFAEKHGAEVVDNGLDKAFKYKGVLYDLPMALEPIETMEPMRLANQSDMKAWLVSEGWIPTTWSDVDLTVDNKKQKVSPDKFKEKVYRYCKDTHKSPFAPYRCKHLGVRTVKQMYMKMLEHDLKRPLKVISSPKFTVNVDKDLCPNLEKMSSDVGFVSDVAKWLTIRHRRNAILSPKGSGFIAHLKDDGRIPTPANTCGCSTSRFTHQVVCNIPRVTSMYGDIMRALFGVETDKRQQIGYDFSGLEARVEGHFTMPFYGGEEYAEALLASKPNDIHCYSEDTEILTRDGWKLFSEVTTETEVAQYEKDCKKITFTKPSEVVWQDYEGSMVSVETNSVNLLVTPNHRMLVERYPSGLQACKLASDLLGRSNSGLRVPVAGVLDDCKTYVKYPELIIATQADGYLSKDSSAITFSFTKERKINRLINLLKGYGIPYTVNKLMRKDRYETTIRILAGEEALEIRSHLSDRKELKDSLVYCSQDQRKTMLDEVGYWDGTFRGGRRNGVILDTTCKKTVEVLELMAIMSNVKSFKSFYEKKTSGFSNKPCPIHRLVLSKMKPAASLTRAVKGVSYYKGKVGCVAVPSTYVVVRRKGKVCVSGNTVNAAKMGVTRDEAKTLKYAVSYGAQPTKLSVQMNWSLNKAKEVFESFWEAASPLKDLKNKLVKEWKKNDKKFIVGIDGRKLFVRSEHSIVNMLFQSTGVICAKKANILHCLELQKRGYLLDVFKDDSSYGKVMLMILYHDEGQFDCCKSLIDFYNFDSKEEAESFTLEGKLLSDVYEEDGKWVRHYSEVGELASECAEESAKYYNMNVNLSADYIIGDNWKVCH